MKVIDLLNKIANGEEVPSKIKYLNYEYVYNYDEKEYQRYQNELWYGLGEDRRLDIILDDEVEILEEEKKIPEKLNKQHFHNRQRQLANKINEIIDYLKSKGE